MIAQAMTCHLPALTLSGLLIMPGCGGIHWPASANDHHVNMSTQPLDIAGVPSSSGPVTLNSPFWTARPAVTLNLSLDRLDEGAVLQEPASAQMAHDQDAIYLRLDLTDRDLCTTATTDHDLLFQTGDVAEWFIGSPPRPELDPDTGEPTGRLLPGVYLELHTAPNGLRSAYRIARPGLIEKLQPIPFTAEVQLHGTLNDHTDEDQGWSVLFTLPLDTLRDAGIPTSPLTTLIARYNYGNDLPLAPNGNGSPELTMWPPQPRTAFHLRPSHASLNLTP